MATKKKSEVEIIAENEKVYNRYVEVSKFRSDYLKHIATLDTGSILILATLLQKPISPGTDIFVAISMISFLISLAGVNITQYILADHLLDSVNNIELATSAKQKRINRAFTFFSYLGFGIGISFLIGFAVVNF